MERAIDVESGKGEDEQSRSELINSYGRLREKFNRRKGSVVEGMCMSSIKKRLIEQEGFTEEDLRNLDLEPYRLDNAEHDRQWKEWFLSLPEWKRLEIFPFGYDHVL